MSNFETVLKQFDYQFPAELIAQTPTHPRDHARLIIYDRAAKTIEHDQFVNLWKYLPANAVLVLNQTKVLPARLEVTKPTGGKARLLYVKHDAKSIWALSDRKLAIGSVLAISAQYKLTVLKKTTQGYQLKPSFPISQTYSVLKKFGITPLPPYIKHPKLQGAKLLKEYNTVFAKTLGSVAAPTASLHFTPKLLKKMQTQGITVKYVTLHVNMGTFAPLTKVQLKANELHSEWYEISKSTAQFLNKAKKTGRPIVAVGTTVVRTLESAANSRGQLTKLSGETNLFITEQSKIKFVNQLITNFHVPKSSLLMLVSALVGRKQLLTLYKLAIKLKYRLFSFGDGMYIK
jgi:S-adenosylmethionine:tRNA ribosyltransferase-isomerase